jgi:hypothetical protein
MSKDWNAEESPDETTDETAAEGGEGSASKSGRGGGGLTKVSFAAVVVAGLVFGAKTTRLYDRFWPGSPQRASAVVPSPAAPAPGVITITRPQPLINAHHSVAPTTAPVAIAPPPATQPAVVATPIAAAPAPIPPRPTPIPPPATPRPATLEARRLAPALSALDTLRGHLQLYTLQHDGKAPEFTRYPAWHQLTRQTRTDGTVDPSGEFGPYVDAAPANPLNDSVVIGLTRRTPEAGKALKTGGKIGWVYCVTTGILYATDADGKTILAERDATAASAR